MSQTETSQTGLGHIARATILVMILFVASRGLGLLREMVIAYQFGASAEMDAYLAAFRLPDFLFYVVAGGALSSAFIPVFTGYLTREDADGAWSLASAVINWVIIVLSILGVGAALVAPYLVKTALPDFTPTQQALTVELMRWMLISTVIFGVSGVVMGILNARQHFLLPALAPVIYNIAIIMGAWLLGPIWGVRGLTVGVILGAAGHLLTQLPALIQHRMRYRLTLAWRNSSLREVGYLMAPRVLGLMAVQLNFVVNIILASTLAVGSVTALNYGWIIMLLPQGVIAQSVATALFPTMAALVAKGERAEMRRIFGITLRNLLFLTLPAATGLIILRETIVSLLLERGAFNANSTAATATALGFFSLGLAGHAIVEIAARAFYALKNTKTPVIIGIIAMVVNVALSLLLMKLFTIKGWLPLGGLALANSIAVSLEMAVMLFLLRSEMKGLSTAGLSWSIAKMALAAGGMALALLLLPATNSLWLSGIIGIITGVLVYIGLSFLLKSEELAVIGGKLNNYRHRQISKPIHN